MRAPSKINIIQLNGTQTSRVFRNTVGMHCVAQYHFIDVHKGERNSLNLTESFNHTRNKVFYSGGVIISWSSRNSRYMGMILLILEIVCDTKVLTIKNYTTGKVLNFRTFPKFMSRISFSALVDTFAVVWSAYCQLDLVIYNNSHVLVSLRRYIRSIHHYYFSYGDKWINYASCKPPWILPIPVGNDKRSLISLKEPSLLNERH